MIDGCTMYDETVMVIELDFFFEQIELDENEYFPLLDDPFLDGPFFDAFLYWLFVGFNLLDISCHSTHRTCPQVVKSTTCPQRIYIVSNRPPNVFRGDKMCGSTGFGNK